MRSKEPGVQAQSEYYLYLPSAAATKLYLYPVCVGHFFYQADYALTRSHYDSFLLMYVVQGSCRTGSQSSGHTASRDHVVLLDCYAPHEYCFPEDSEILWIHFDGPLARPYYEIITAEHGNILSVENPYPITHNIDKVLQIFRTSSPVKEAEVSSRITQMLNSLLSASSASGGSLTRSQAVESALTYINEHFSEPLSLDTLAANSNLSPYYFTRVFTAETGMSPHQYLIAVRLNSAKFLLRTHGLSIKEIAFSSGFNSESSFCATFRKWEKTTPSEYRSLAFSGE